MRAGHATFRLRLHTADEPLHSDARGRSALPRYVRVWFVLDALLALAPPLYWSADRATSAILGIPMAMLYFLAVGTFITLSLIAANFSEADKEENVA